MATGLAVGGDVEQALHSVGVPSYVPDATGIVRWINPAAERLLGDIRGRHYTSFVAPEETRRASELFSQKTRHLPSLRGDRLLGFDRRYAGGRRACSVPLMSGERVVGVFGLIEGHPTTRPQHHPRTSPPVKSRCFGFSNRAARRSRSPPSST